METPCKFIIAKLSICKLGSSLTELSALVLIELTDRSTDQWIERLAMINLHGVSSTRENEKALKQELNRLIITSIAELIRHPVESTQIF